MDEVVLDEWAAKRVRFADRLSIVAGVIFIGVSLVLTGLVVSKEGWRANLDLVAIAIFWAVFMLPGAVYLMMGLMAEKHQIWQRILCIAFAGLYLIPPLYAIGMAIVYVPMSLLSVPALIAAVWVLLLTWVIVAQSRAVSIVRRYKFAPHGFEVLCNPPPNLAQPVQPLSNEDHP